MLSLTAGQVCILILLGIGYIAMSAINHDIEEAEKNYLVQE